MQVQYESTRNTKVTVKRERSTRFLLNIVGGILFIGLFVTMFTVPLSIDRNGFFHMQEAALGVKKQKEFISFIVGAASLYFLTVNLFFWKEFGRKIVYGILLVVVGTCFFQVISLYN